MKAQISMEYVVILGFALLLTIPTIVIFFSQSTANVEQVNSMQARQIARKIVDNAEKVYYLGKPSVTTIKVVMPKSVEAINVTNRNIIMTVRGSAGASNLVEPSSVNLSGTLQPSSGVKYIRIENIGDSANISYLR